MAAMRSRRRSPTRGAAATACSPPPKRSPASGHARRRPGVEVAVVERAAIERVVGAGTRSPGPGPVGGAVAQTRTCGRPARPSAGAMWCWRSTRSTTRTISARSCVRRQRSPCARWSCPSGAAPSRAASWPRPPPGRSITVPVVEVVDLARALDELAALGYRRVALDAAAEATVDAVPAVDDLVLVLGAEGTGAAPPGRRALRLRRAPADRAGHGQPRTSRSRPASPSTQLARRPRAVDAPRTEAGRRKSVETDGNRPCTTQATISRS